MGTSNELILYWAAIDSNAINFVSMQAENCNGSIVSSWIEDVLKEPLKLSHELMADENQQKSHIFMLCSLLKTRYKYNADWRNIPLHSIVASKADTDWFALSHADELILKGTKTKIAEMLSATNTDVKWTTIIFFSLFI